LASKHSNLKALASADALISLSGHSRQQVWDASALRPAPALLQGVPIEEGLLELPAAQEGEEVSFDYAAVGSLCAPTPCRYCGSSYQNGSCSLAHRWPITPAAAWCAPAAS
jgi:hypothetical protein